MEPMSRATYYEDVYTRSKRDDDDPIEAGGRFDLCEDSSEDETEDESSKHTKKKTNQLKSYGTIKKPTRKTIPYPATCSCARANGTKTSQTQKQSDKPLTRSPQRVMRGAQSEQYPYQATTNHNLNISMCPQARRLQAPKIAPESSQPKRSHKRKWSSDASRLLRGSTESASSAWKIARESTRQAKRRRRLRSELCGTQQRPRRVSSRSHRSQVSMCWSKGRKLRSNLSIAPRCRLAKSKVGQRRERKGRRQASSGRRRRTGKARMSI
jgi:hypothetical protein